MNSKFVELSLKEEDQHAEVAKAANVKELDDWKKFDVFEPRRDCKVSKQIAQTRWVLTWKMVDGQESANARLVAKDYWGPGVREGIMDTSGCVRLRSSHLQATSLCAIKEGKPWSLDSKNAFLQAGRFTRNVLLQAQAE